MNTAAAVFRPRSYYDEAPSGFRLSRGALSAIAAAIAVHAGLGVYLWKARFEPEYRTFSEEEVTDVQLVRPAPPPPPPPPPPPKAETPPPKPKSPPRVQPRPPRNITLPTVAPLPIPPVPEPVVVREPPVIRPAPPPAPPAPPPAPPVITRPDWLQRPSGREIARYYPDRAARREVEGRAVISCTVTAAGRLSGCEVQSESPRGEDFGAAALKMSRHFRMRPMTRDGVPVSGGTIRIPIRFNLPD